MSRFSVEDFCDPSSAGKTISIFCDVIDKLIGKFRHCSSERERFEATLLDLRGYLLVLLENDLLDKYPLLMKFVWNLLVLVLQTNLSKLDLVEWLSSSSPAFIPNTLTKAWVLTDLLPWKGLSRRYSRA